MAGGRHGGRDLAAPDVTGPEHPLTAPRVPGASGHREKVVAVCAVDTIML